MSQTRLITRDAQSTVEYRIFRIRVLSDLNQNTRFNSGNRIRNKSVNLTTGQRTAKSGTIPNITPDLLRYLWEVNSGDIERYWFCSRKDVIPGDML